jgi:hypothetical protein
VTSLTDKAYRWVVPALGLWLVTWIFLSWAGVQDDAFIHLRYADNLFQTHLITYDGVHPNYGASSLLYVCLLSFLRTFAGQPDLPRIVSSCVHVLLIAGLVFLFLRAIPREAHLARLLSLITLVIFVAPSAVRWLDDGMETGLVLCFVAILCWVTFRQSTRPSVTGLQYLAVAILGFFSVLLRTELLLLCGLSFAIIVWSRLFVSEGEAKSNQPLLALLSGSHLLLGAVLAIVFIRLKMHVFLPDTALAKSDGTANWLIAFYVTAKVLAGALSFGVGVFLLWLITILLSLRAGRFSITTLFANLAFPILFALAAVRGQQIQGARYFVWTFFFSILWNVFELSHVPPGHQLDAQGNSLTYCFLAVLLVTLPFESTMLYPMLRDRARLLKQFEGNHLENLQGKRGFAFDIGLIGYFSRADICDMAGLVNGRDKARETTQQRLEGCVATHLDFMFLDLGGIGYAANYLPINDWQICSQYDFENVHQSNRHYLIVPRTTAPEVCKSIANSVPSEIAPLFVKQLPSATQRLQQERSPGEMTITLSKTQ